MATQQLEKTETAGVERASQHRVYSPAVDIYEHNDHVVLLADMPGVDKDSIDVTLEKDLITLNGKVKDLDAGKRPLAYSEYGVGDYQRSFQLGGRYPNSAMGTIALMKQTFMDADWYGDRPGQDRGVDEKRRFEADSSEGGAFEKEDRSERMTKLLKTKWRKRKWDYET